MGDCVVCGESAMRICRGCKVIFCCKHEVAHEKRKLRVHNFSQIELIHNPLKTLDSEKEKLLKSSLSGSSHNLKNLTDIYELCNNQPVKTCINFNELRLMSTNDAVRALSKQHQIFLNASTPRYEDIIITHDDKYIISHVGKLITIWNFSSYKQEAILQGHEKLIKCIAVSRDSKYIISGSDDKTIRIWNLLTRTQESVLLGHSRTLTSVSITSDNKYIFSTDVLNLRIWSFEQKTLVKLIDGHGHKDPSYPGVVISIPLKMITVSSDEKYLIYPIIDALVVWNIQKNAQEIVLIKDKIDEDLPWRMLITTDTQFVIAGYDSGCIRIWNREKSEQEATLEVDDDPVVFLKVTSDAKYIVSGSNDVRIWNFSLRKIENVLAHEKQDLDDLKLTGDDKYIIYALSDCSIRVWGFQEKQQVAILKGHTTRINKIVLSNDNDRIITVSNGRSVRIWSLKQKRLIYSLPGHVKQVTSIAISRGNKYIVSGSYDFTVRIWNAQEKTQEKVLVGHEECVTCVGITSDNKYVLSASDDKTIRIWKIKDKTLKARGNDDDKSEASTTNRYNCRYIASGSDERTTRRWILQTWRMKRKGAVLQVGVNGMNSIAITRCGKYIVISASLLLWLIQ